MNTFKRHQ